MRKECESMRYFEGSVTYWGTVAVEDDATEEEIAVALAKDIEHTIDAYGLPVMYDDVENIKEIPRSQYE